jgi:hypothetical protein
MIIFEESLLHFLGKLEISACSLCYWNIPELDDVIEKLYRMSALHVPVVGCTSCTGRQDAGYTSCTGRQTVLHGGGSESVQPVDRYKRTTLTIYP